MTLMHRGTGRQPWTGTEVPRRLILVRLPQAVPPWCCPIKSEWPRWFLYMHALFHRADMKEWRLPSKPGWFKSWTGPGISSLQEKPWLTFYFLCKCTMDTEALGRGWDVTQKQAVCLVCIRSWVQALASGLKQTTKRARVMKAKKKNGA